MLLRAVPGRALVPDPGPLPLQPPRRETPPPLNPGPSIPGTLMYMAPEMFKGEKYDEKVDVFSFAVIM